MIDLDALDASIAEGEKKNLFVAPIVKELIAELRAARGERAAVVAWLRERDRLNQDEGEPNAVSVTYWNAANRIERGEHRREGER